MTYLETYNLRYQSQTLKPRMVVACVKAAQDILNEDTGTADHAKRVLWARSALTAPDGMAERMLWGVLGNSTIQGSGDSASDSDIQFTVNSLIHIYMEEV